MVYSYAVHQAVLIACSFTGCHVFYGVVFWRVEPVAPCVHRFILTQLAQGEIAFDLQTVFVL